MKIKLRELTPEQNKKNLMIIFKEASKFVILMFAFVVLLKASWKFLIWIW